MKITQNLLLATATGALLAFAPVPQVRAADLGGDCCADLEERVAELEATTARKGNRKVSLTISGWVARELYVWDDGDMSDAYVVDTSSTLATHFKFSGKAEMKPGWRAGFVIHVEEADNGSLGVSQLDDGDGTNDTAINTLEAKWYIESDRLGRVTVGQQSQASDNAAILADFSGSLVQSNWVLFDGASFFLRPKGSASGAAGLEGNTWGGALGFCGHTGLGIGGDCNGVPLDAIRYDSPSMYGFIFSASWGENDFWDVALNYQAEWNSIKFKAAAAYDFFNDSKGNPLLNSHAKGSYFQVGAMAMHTPTGLFLYGAYGNENVDNRFINTGDGTIQDVKSGDHWFAKAGIRRNWFSPGATVLYGEYGRYNDMFGGFSCGGTVGGTNIGDACGVGLGGIHISGSEMDRWGLGVVQEIDAASMSVWAKWVAFDGDIDFNDANGGKHSQDYEQLNSFLVGAMINF